MYLAIFSWLALSRLTCLLLAYLLRKDRSSSDDHHELLDAISSPMNRFQPPVVDSRNGPVRSMLSMALRLSFIAARA